MILINQIKKTIGIVLLVLLIGCSPDILYIDRNNTIYVNRTFYINQSINNCTTPVCEVCLEANSFQTGVYDKDYVLSLIRQLKKYEAKQDKEFNETECKWELNKSNAKLEKTNTELCRWNSSWC